MCCFASVLCLGWSGVCSLAAWGAAAWAAVPSRRRPMERERLREIFRGDDESEAEIMAVPSFELRSTPVRSGG